MGLLFSSSPTPKNNEEEGYFKSDGSRLTREQIKQITWEAKSLGQKQREEIRQSLSKFSGGVSKQQFIRTIRELREEGVISEFEKNELLGLI